MEECFLCGAPATTVDHIPPQGFFEEVPSNIIKVPACQHCNNSFSRDEEYVQTVFVAGGTLKSRSALRLWLGKIRRAFSYRPGLRARLARNIVPALVQSEAGVFVGKLPGLVVEGPRVLRVLRKMVKGIHYHERGERLEDADLLIFRDQDVGKDFETLTRSWSEMDMGEEFRYRSQYDENGGGLWLEFYRTNWWFVLLGDVARDYPIRPSKS